MGVNRRAISWMAIGWFVCRFRGSSFVFVAGAMLSVAVNYVTTLVAAQGVAIFYAALVVASSIVASVAMFRVSDKLENVAVAAFPQASKRVHKTGEEIREGQREQFREGNSSARALTRAGSLLAGSFWVAMVGIAGPRFSLALVLIVVAVLVAFVWLMWVVVAPSKQRMQRS